MKVLIECHFPGQVGGATMSIVHISKVLHYKFIVAIHRFQFNRNGMFEFRITAKMLTAGNNQ